MATALKSWKQITKWYRINAPDKNLNFPAPATNKELAELETSLGVSLPDDVRSLYLLHNGTFDESIFPYGYYLMSLQDIVADWTRLSSDGVGTEPPDPPDEVSGPIKKVWWNKKWVPLTGNGGGDHHCIDFDPDVGGTVGQIFKYSHEVGPSNVVANSFGEWLVRFASDLNAGRYRFDPNELWLVPVRKH